MHITISKHRELYISDSDMLCWKQGGMLALRIGENGGACISH